MADTLTMKPAGVTGAAEGDFAPDAATAPSLPEDLRDLAEKARAYAIAELAFQKSRAAYAGAQARSVALLGISAAVLVFFAVMALVVGAVIALAPVIGGWAATGVVTGLLLAIAFALLVTAKARWKRTMAMIADHRDPA